MLQQRKLHTDRLDRDAHLRRIALCLRARDEAGAPHAEVDQRDHVFEQHLLDLDPGDLSLVGGAKLLLGGRPARFAADAAWIRTHRVTSAVPSCPA
jgi:hypothetical protein